jgi:phosphotransferase system IIA component
MAIGIDLWLLAILIVVSMWIGYGIGTMGRKREDEEQMQAAGADQGQGGMQVKIKKDSLVKADPMGNVSRKAAEQILPSRKKAAREQIRQLSTGQILPKGERLTAAQISATIQQLAAGSFQTANLQAANLRVTGMQAVTAEQPQVADTQTVGAQATPAGQPQAAGTQATTAAQVTVAQTAAAQVTAAQATAAQTAAAQVTAAQTTAEQPQVADTQADTAAQAAAGQPQAAGTQAAAEQPQAAGTQAATEQPQAAGTQVATAAQGATEPSHTTSQRRWKTSFIQTTFLRGGSSNKAKTSSWEAASGHNASAHWRTVTEQPGTGEKKTGKILDTTIGHTAREPHRKRGEAVHVGFCIGCPVQGEAKALQDDYQQGFRIYPQQGKVYAPASGKIIRLFPTGNAFRMRTDEGIELTLRVGTDTEELEGMYFRPRIIQNEVVAKGKLLLEFDMEGIKAEGYDTSLWMIVEDHEDYRGIEFAKDGITKSGESLLWIRK